MSALASQCRSGSTILSTPSSSPWYTASYCVGSDCEFASAAVTVAAARTGAAATAATSTTCHDYYDDDDDDDDGYY